MLVRRVCVGGNVGVVRCVEAYERAGAGDAIEFRDDREHVVHVLDHLIGDDQIERVIGERIGHAVEIMDHVRLCARVAVETRRAGRLMFAAADVENLQR